MTKKRDLTEQKKGRWSALFILLEVSNWPELDWRKLYKKLALEATRNLFSLFDIAKGIPRAKFSIVATLAGRDDYGPELLIPLMEKSEDDLIVQTSIAEAAAKRPGKYLVELLSQTKHNNGPARKIASAIADCMEISIEEFYPVWEKYFSCEVSDALEKGMGRRLFSMPTAETLSYLFNSKHQKFTGICTAVLLAKGDYDLPSVVNPILLYQSPSDCDIKSALVRLATEKINDIPEQQLAPFIEGAYTANNLYEFILAAIERPDCPLNAVRKALDSNRLSAPHEKTVLISAAKNKDYELHGLYAFVTKIHTVGNDEAFAKALAGREDISLHEIHAYCVCNAKGAGLTKLAPFMIEHLLDRLNHHEMNELFNHQSSSPNLQQKIVAELYNRTGYPTYSIFQLMNKTTTSVVQMAIVTGHEQRAGASISMLKKALPLAIAGDVVAKILNIMANDESCTAELLLKNFEALKSHFKTSKIVILSLVDSLKKCRDVKRSHFKQLQNYGNHETYGPAHIAIASLLDYATPEALEDFIACNLEEVQLAILSAIGNRKDCTISHLLEMATKAKGNAEQEVITLIKNKGKRMPIRKLLETWKITQGRKTKNALLEMIASRKAELEKLAGKL